MEIVYRKTVEWSVDGRHFRFVADDHVGEFRTPEGEIVTLSVEEWRAFADAIGLSYSAKPKPTIARIISSDIPNAGQPWTRELDERLEFAMECRNECGRTRARIWENLGGNQLTAHAPRLGH